jgi:hypothetical protein
LRCLDAQPDALAACCNPVVEFSALFSEGSDLRRHFLHIPVVLAELEAFVIAASTRAGSVDSFLFPPDADKTRRRVLHTILCAHRHRRHAPTHDSPTVGKPTPVHGLPPTPDQH